MFERYRNSNKQPQPFDISYGSNKRGHIYVPGPELVRLSILEEERDEWEKQLQIPPPPCEVIEVDDQQPAAS